MNLIDTPRIQLYPWIIKNLHGCRIVTFGAWHFLPVVTFKRLNFAPQTKNIFRWLFVLIISNLMRCACHEKFNMMKTRNVCLRTSCLLINVFLFLLYLKRCNVAILFFVWKMKMEHVFVLMRAYVSWITHRFELQNRFNSVYY